MTKQILVIEDDLSILRLQQRILHDAGYGVEIAVAWLGLQRLDDIAKAWQLFTSPGFAAHFSVSSPKAYG